MFGDEARFGRMNRPRPCWAPVGAVLATAPSGCESRLPIVVVDEEIYRRLPAFMIATVDKFANVPWEGRSGAFFGHVERSDQIGFYGAAEPGGGTRLKAELRPIDLIIQDELHLISGPLGTIAGLYETAFDLLAARKVNGEWRGPKIVASTATVRRAEIQIRNLFGRERTAIFPPPGIGRGDSFFARIDNETPSRLYFGVASPGRGPKLVFLRALQTLLSGAAALSSGGPNDPADPYLTALCYFNALRELGGARRIVDDEVRAHLTSYGRNRVRREPTGAPFADRALREIQELTSRYSTDQVSEARTRLGLPVCEKNAVDVAMATNMISVGLDIGRLGLMVVQGQPKTAAEYIQATSRVGREAQKPGLVVTLLNIHKPRDRTHYEQFRSFHLSFYRAVEATSVTPFAPRALDRALVQRWLPRYDMSSRASRRTRLRTRWPTMPLRTSGSGPQSRRRCKPLARTARRCSAASRAWMNSRTLGFRSRTSRPGMATTSLTPTKSLSGGCFRSHSSISRTWTRNGSGSSQPARCATPSPFRC
jgi:hypothetical protein